MNKTFLLLMSNTLHVFFGFSTTVVAFKSVWSLSLLTKSIIVAIMFSVIWFTGLSFIIFEKKFRTVKLLPKTEISFDDTKVASSRSNRRHSAESQLFLKGTFLCKSRLRWT